MNVTIRSLVWRSPNSRADRAVDRHETRYPWGYAAVELCDPVTDEQDGKYVVRGVMDLAWFKTDGRGGGPMLFETAADAMKAVDQWYYDKVMACLTEEEG